MWGRVIELILGCWLALSPFIFRHPGDETVLWFSDLFSALAVIVLALVSFWPPLRYAHVAIVVVALWLIGFGFWASGYPAPPALQNDIMVGLLLLMFAIIPNEANLPPRAWRSHEVGTQSPTQAEAQQ
jgi:hypothetical protein